MALKLFWVIRKEVLNMFHFLYLWGSVVKVHHVMSVWNLEISVISCYFEKTLNIYIQVVHIAPPRNIFFFLMLSCHEIIPIQKCIGWIPGSVWFTANCVPWEGLPITWLQCVYDRATYCLTGTELAEQSARLAELHYASGRSSKQEREAAQGTRALETAWSFFLAHGWEHGCFP